MRSTACWRYFEFPAPALPLPALSAEELDVVLLLTPALVVLVLEPRGIGTIMQQNIKTINL
jgi:hypothetical protein